jgi:SAM-dependent methyltransferase
MTRAGRGAPAAGPQGPGPRQRRAFSIAGGPTETEGEPALARTVGELFALDRAIERALTHGFHAYAGRMHPTIARRAIARWSRTGDAVLDPFCGSGTVLCEAYAAGRAAVGLDASPLAVELASVRTSVLGADGRRRLVEQAGAIARASAEAARARRRVAVPAWAAGERRRFEPHVALELYGLHARVMDTPADGVGRALRMVLSALLVKFMRPRAAAAEPLGAARGPGGHAPRGPIVTAGGERPAAPGPRRVGRGVPSGFFAAKAEELAAGLAALEAAAPPGTPPPEVHLGDARSHPSLGGARFALVLSSPPYAGTYDYAEEHAVRFRWLGLDERALRARQLGARGRASAQAVEEWRAGRRAWLAEMARVLAPGGHAVLVVGDGVIGGAAEDAARETASAARAAGLTLLARASQPRPLHDPRVRALYRGAPRREHILLLRRP